MRSCRAHISARSSSSAWSKPMRCRKPWHMTRTVSLSTLLPFSAAFFATASGHTTMSPSGRLSQSAGGSKAPSSRLAVFFVDFGHLGLSGEGQRYLALLRRLGQRLLRFDIVGYDLLNAFGHSGVPEVLSLAAQITAVYRRFHFFRPPSPFRSRRACAAPLLLSR